MHNPAPLLSGLSPVTRVIFTILLILVSLFTVLFLGLLLAMPFSGMGFTALTQLPTDYSDPASMNLLRYMQVLQSAGLFIVPALLAGWLFGGNPLRFLGLSRSPGLLIWLLTTTLMFSLLPFVSEMIAFNEAMKLPEALRGMESWMKMAEASAARLMEAFIRMDGPGLLLFNLFMIAILPAVGEELLFRGLLQRLFRDWTGNVHVAIILSATLFAAMHMQFYGVIPRMVLGMLFGYLYWWSGSLWIPIWAHLLNNGMVVVVAYLSQHGLFDGNYEHFGSTDNLLVVLLSMVVSGAMILIIHKRL